MEYEHMYPVVVRRMMPYVDEAINTYGDADVTEEGLNRMMSHVMTRSGMMMDPPAHHNERSLSDVARFLLLARLFDEDEFFFPTPPFFFPIAPFPRRRRRRR